MNESTVGLQIISNELEREVAGIADFEQRVRTAMAPVADSHWMFPGDSHADLRFRGALAAVMLAPETTEDEKEGIRRTLAQLRSLNALLQGVPVDTEAMLAEQEEHPPLPLMKWWHEAREKKAA